MCYLKKLAAVAAVGAAVISSSVSAQPAPQAAPVVPSPSQPASQPAAPPVGTHQPTQGVAQPSAAPVAVPIQPGAEQPAAVGGQGRPRRAAATRPVPYCWHNSGWNGPGWYRCGSQDRVGYGWGGGPGWQGWPAPIARRVQPPRRQVRVAVPAYVPAPSRAPVYAPVASSARDVGRFAPPAF